MECKMATAILAQGNRLEHSRAVLRLTSEDKKVAATCKAAADQVLHNVTIWSRWWCIAVSIPSTDLP